MNYEKDAEQVFYKYYNNLSLRDKTLSKLFMINLAKVSAVENEVNNRNELKCVLKELNSTDMEKEIRKISSRNPHTIKGNVIYIDFAFNGGNKIVQ